MLKADLHVHTYYSDGLLSPAEVIAEGKKAGLDTIAITDHDCMLAYPEFSSLCKNSGIIPISGIEVSAYEGEVKVHTLGYGVNGESPCFKEFLKTLYEGSVKRTEDIIFKLKKYGINLTFDEVLKERYSPSSPIHAMYIACAGYKKGYAKTPHDFYNLFLSGGKVAFSFICRPSAEQAIEAINASGGFASLAHPGRIDLKKDELLKLILKLKACNLSGIEGVYSAHTHSETAYYKEIARTYDLLVTGGSDTHVLGGSKRIGTPPFYVDKALEDKLKI